jgi:hypothetical protein
MTQTDQAVRANVDGVLQLIGGFRAEERPKIVDRLGSLDHRLATWRAESVGLSLSVKNRDCRDQRVSLECRVARLPRMAATSTLSDLDAALSEVRDEMRRQIDDTVSRRQPRNNRHLRQPRDAADQAAAPVVADDHALGEAGPRPPAA